MKIIGQGISLGGGGNTELTIVGGTTRPIKAANNTMWVNTDSVITTWVLSATKPETPLEGMVWVSLQSKGSVSASAPIGDNWVRVYPITAEQYVGGEWYYRGIETYQEGIWLGSALHLLKGADLCEENGGEWSDTGWSITAGTGWSKAGYSITNEGIVIKNPTSSNNVKWGMCGKQESVDMTPYNTLTVVYDITEKTTDHLYFAVCASKMNISTGTPAAELDLIGGQVVGAYTQTIDVSSLNGSYYFAFGLLRQGGIVLKEVYLT